MIAFPEITLSSPFEKLEKVYSKMGEKEIIPYLIYFTKVKTSNKLGEDQGQFKFEIKKFFNKIKNKSEITINSNLLNRKGTLGKVLTPLYHNYNSNSLNRNGNLGNILTLLYQNYNSSLSFENLIEINKYLELFNVLCHEGAHAAVAYTDGSYRRIEEGLPTAYGQLSVYRLLNEGDETSSIETTKNALEKSLNSQTIPDERKKIYVAPALNIIKFVKNTKNASVEDIIADKISLEYVYSQFND